MKKVTFIILILITCGIAKAQQDPMLSQYMFNHLLVNPGYAGSKDYAMGVLQYRTQWTGFDGAPQTALASIHGPWHEKKVGLGLTLMDDHLGVTNRMYVGGDYAYHIPLSDNLTLGLGLSADVSRYTAKNSDLTYWDANDPNFIANTQSNILPNFGAGAFLYARKFYLGLSVPQLISYDPSKIWSVDLTTSLAPRQVRHVFAEAGYVWEVNTELAIRPSVLVKYVKNAPVEADINLNAFIHNLIWVGASYRTGDAAVALAQVQLTKKLRLGYSYDFTITELNKYSNGTHEIMLGYDFGYDVQKMKTPRYF